MPEIMAERARIWPTVGPLLGIPGPLEGSIRGASSIEEFCKLNEMLPLGVRALMSGFLIQTWTAFETLAVDLWIAALNARPMGLAELTGSPKRIAKLVNTAEEKRPDNEVGGENQNSPSEQSKSVPLN
jgi:hypothetical protein